MVPRFGIGYDIHRLVAGRKLILGGVEIPHPKGLEGHSDADVLLHAVCDALLGALGRGDIGEHFPNTDERFRDISSLALLDEVMKIAVAEGYQVGNVDVVLQAEEPNIKEFKNKMRQNIAQRLKIQVDAVNIKATTLEKIGALGEKQGIAALASAVVFKG